MTEQPSPEALASDLVDLLTVNREEERRYVGRAQKGGVGRVFGGQVIAQALQAAQATAPASPVKPRSNLSISDDLITFDGQTKRWEEMTPAEKARVRAELAQAREELKRVNTEEIRREVREAMAQTKIDKEEIRREMAVSYTHLRAQRD